MAFALQSSNTFSCRAALKQACHGFCFPATLQGAIQSSFLWGYITTQLLGGALADKHGGKRVLAVGLLWFSVATMLLPAALSKNIVAAGLTVPAVMAVRCAVVSDGAQHP